jgi:hypothetical protein
MRPPVRNTLSHRCALSLSRYPKLRPNTGKPLLHYQNLTKEHERVAPLTLDSSPTFVSPARRSNAATRIRNTGPRGFTKSREPPCTCPVRQPGPGKPGQPLRILPAPPLARTFDRDALAPQRNTGHQTRPCPARFSATPDAGSNALIPLGSELPLLPHSNLIPDT